MGGLLRFLNTENNMQNNSILTELSKDESWELQEVLQQLKDEGERYCVDVTNFAACVSNNVAHAKMAADIEEDYRRTLNDMCVDSRLIYDKDAAFEAMEEELKKQ